MFFLQDWKRVALKHLVTHDMGLMVWGDTRLTALPSGTFVLYRKIEEAGNRVIQTYRWVLVGQEVVWFLCGELVP